MEFEKHSLSSAMLICAAHKLLLSKLFVMHQRLLLLIQGGFARRTQPMQPRSRWHVAIQSVACRQGLNFQGSSVCTCSILSEFEGYKSLYFVSIHGCFSRGHMRKHLKESSVGL